jgi:hypothetical protein
MKMHAFVGSSLKFKIFDMHILIPVMLILKIK